MSRIMYLLGALFKWNRRYSKIHLQLRNVTLGPMSGLDNACMSHVKSSTKASLKSACDSGTSRLHSACRCQ